MGFLSLEREIFFDAAELGGWIGFSAVWSNVLRPNSTPVILLEDSL